MKKIYDFSNYKLSDTIKEKLEKQDKWPISTQIPKAGNNYQDTIKDITCVDISKIIGWVNNTEFKDGILYGDIELNNKYIVFKNEKITPVALYRKPENLNEKTTIINFSYFSFIT